MEAVLCYVSSSVLMLGGSVYVFLLQLGGFVASIISSAHKERGGQIEYKGES